MLYRVFKSLANALVVTKKPECNFTLFCFVLFLKSDRPHSVYEVFSNVTYLYLIFISPTQRIRKSYKYVLKTLVKEATTKTLKYFECNYKFQDQIFP